MNKERTPKIIVKYLADGTLRDIFYPGTKKVYEKFGAKRSFFMPRSVSRIQLEVMKVRVEKLQDIHPEEIKLEGASSEGYLKPGAAATSHGFATLMDFILLWNSINAKRGFGWIENPWVWVVEFQLLEVKNK